MFCQSKKYFLFHILAIIIIATPGFAQNKEKREDKKEQNQVQPKAPKINDSQLKMFMDKIEIVGELEKPQAVFIIPGKNPEIDDIRIRRSFFNNIFRKVEHKGKIITKIQTEPAKNRKDYIPW